MAEKRKGKEIVIVEDDDELQLSLRISTWTPKFQAESDSRPKKKVRFADECYSVITAAQFAASRDPKLKTLLTTRMALQFDYIPTKEQEELIKANGPIPRPLKLVEIRDVFAPPVMDPHNPWTIKKRLNPYEVASGSIAFRFRDLSEHMLRYWDFNVARGFVEDGCPVRMPLLDVTDEKTPKMYENENVYFSILHTFDCYLTCPELMRDRKLKPRTVVYFYWNPKDLSFHFKASM